MKTKQTQRDSDEGEGELHASRIIAAVITALGRPANLWAVQVRRLWADHYRVNVLTGSEVNSAAIAHSYFLTVDAGGNILDASPAISRHY